MAAALHGTEGLGEAGRRSLRLLIEEFEHGAISIDEYASRLKELGVTVDKVAAETDRLKAANATLISGITAVGTVFQNLTTITNSLFGAYANLLNMQSGYVNQQVTLYQAQIAVYQQQNLYTQALALHATAVQLFGAQSVEATRTQTAVSLQNVLLQQNENQAKVAAAQKTYAWWTTLVSLGSQISSVTTATAGLVITLAGLQAVMGGAGISGLLGSLGIGGAAAGGAEVAAGQATLEEAGAFGGAEMAGEGGILAGGLALAPETLGVSAAVAAIATAPLWGPALFNLTKSAGASFGNWLRGYQYGGQVKETGMALVHEGETVIPKGGAPVTMVPITINATSEVDLAKVRQVVSETIAQAQLKTMRSRGGVYP